MSNGITTSGDDDGMSLGDIKKSSVTTTTTTLPIKMIKDSEITTSTIPSSLWLDKYVPPEQNADDSWFIGVTVSFLVVLILELISCLWRRYQR